MNYFFISCFIILFSLMVYFGFENKIEKCLNIGALVISIIGVIVYFSAGDGSVQTRSALQTTMISVVVYPFYFNIFFSVILTIKKIINVSLSKNSFKKSFSDFLLLVPILFIHFCVFWFFGIALLGRAI